MDCAFDDDRTIVVAMVDFAISAQFGLIYSNKLLASTVLIIDLSNFNTSFYMVTLLCIVFLIIFLLELILNLVLLIFLIFIILGFVY